MTTKYPIKTRGLGQSPKPAAGVKKAKQLLLWPEVKTVDPEGSWVGKKPKKH